MEKNMETTIMGYTGTIIRISSFISGQTKVSKSRNPQVPQYCNSRSKTKTSKHHSDYSVWDLKTAI